MARQAPTLNKHDYMTLIVTQIKSIKSSLTSMGIYPAFPPAGNFFKALDQSIVFLQDNEPDNCRTRLLLALKYAQEFQSFDSGDQYSKSIVKNNLTLLRAAMQNGIDNYKKAPSIQKSRNVEQQFRIASHDAKVREQETQSRLSQIWQRIDQKKPCKYLHCTRMVYFPEDYCWSCQKDFRRKREHDREMERRMPTLDDDDDRADLTEGDFDFRCLDDHQLGWRQDDI